MFWAITFVGLTSSAGACQWVDTFVHPFNLENGQTVPPGFVVRFALDDRIMDIPRETVASFDVLDDAGSVVPLTPWGRSSTYEAFALPDWLAPGRYRYESVDNDYLPVVREFEVRDVATEPPPLPTLVTATRVAFADWSRDIICSPRSIEGVETHVMVRVPAPLGDPRGWVIEIEKLDDDGLPYRTAWASLDDDARYESYRMWGPDHMEPRNLCVNVRVRDPRDAVVHELPVWCGDERWEREGDGCDTLPGRTGAWGPVMLLLVALRRRRAQD